MKETYMGRTTRTHEEVRNFIKKLKNGNFSKSSYDVTSNNCIHFAHELCKYLLDGEGLPLEYQITMYNPVMTLAKPFSGNGCSSS